MATRRSNRLQARLQVKENESVKKLREKRKRFKQELGNCRVLHYACMKETLGEYLQIV